MKTLPSFVLACSLFIGTFQAQSETLFQEAEAFDHLGGWKIETIFTDILGSPYILAHGLGQPVEDASTTIRVEEGGSYRVWVRTKDWVAPWDAPGAPGKFKLAVNQEMSETTFGVEGAEWHWQEGGTVQFKKGDNEIRLVDLTGFDGRCDALIFSNETGFSPPDGDRLKEFRRRRLNLPDGPEDMGEFDLVVVGGGYSGMATAISAARQSLKVALIQDRFVLGGNGSSEVRVWANGGTMRGKYPHLGEIVEEFADHAPDSPGTGDDYGDDHKKQVCLREPTLSLFLGHFVHDVRMKEGAIQAVLALEVRTGRERVFRGQYFTDCTGHGTVGAMAGADFILKEDKRMGMSNMWFWQFEETPQEWPETPWALDLEVGDFPRQIRSKSLLEGKPFMKGEWFWESGFDKHPIDQAELIRDWNLRAVFGAFSALKHGSEKQKHTHAALKWVAHVGGTRESRLLEGDVRLTREDIVERREFPDGTVPTTWDIDLHYPKEQFAQKFPDSPFISRAEFGAGVDRKEGYPVPYRCFYSKNIPNLFMAGRCISVTHEALGTVRVMRTCGMMGEVVGKAAYLCVKHKIQPRGVYTDYLVELLDLIQQPGAMRRDTVDGVLYPDPQSPEVRPYYNKGADVVTGQLASSPEGTALSGLKGIVIDDTQAELKGDWGRGTGLTPHIGAGYRYAAKDKEASAIFRIQIPKSGRYEVRVAWAGHENRATRVAIALQREGHSPITLRVNQQTDSNDPSGFHSLGVFDFHSGAAAVVISNPGANGYIHADAVQLLELE